MADHNQSITGQIQQTKLDKGKGALREGKETQSLGHKSSSGRTEARTFFLEVIIICKIVKVKYIFFWLHLTAYRILVP